MNILILRRLSFLFTLLCLTALAAHPGAVFAKRVPPPAAATAPASSAAASSSSEASAGQASADVPAAANDDFNDEPDQNDRHNPIESRHRHRRNNHDDGNVRESLGRSATAPSRSWATTTSTAKWMATWLR
jgi:hypothetical protein